VLLARLAATSAAVAGAPGRLAKTELLATCLREAAPDEVAVVASYLSGELRQRRTGTGWAALRTLPPPADEPSLQVREVDEAFGRLAEVAGKGSAAERRAQVTALFARATRDEQRLLGALVAGELRQGAQAGLLVDAVAVAAGEPVAAVRSALTLAGSLPEVAEAALGGRGLGAFRLQVGRPLSPMLASPGSTLEEALERASPAVVEWKVDGVRVQVHRDGDDVRVFTRSLDDITARVPELVAAALALPVRRAVLDGEAVALQDDGRPHPFQVTASRAASSRAAVPLTPFFFDVLHLDGTDLLGEPLWARAEALARAVPEQWRAPRETDPAAAASFAADALARGHEGVVVKALDAPYAAGRRGAGWLKVKPRHTLDLVVLGVEWGHGRRTGLLSNLHLGARDPAGGFVMLGKTFKGLTDELLRWQTARLQELAVSDDGWQVVVRPELVVEIACDGVQTSPRYPGGVALRFARVLRYREDKPAREADTLDDVRRLFPAGA
jgi:DNA ligase-1